MFFKLAENRYDLTKVENLPLTIDDEIDIIDIIT